MKYLGVIPARSGSKGIKNKNKKLLKGKPLIQYSIEAALNSKIDSIVVSTDDEEIIEIAHLYNLTVIKRPSKLAQDDTPTLPVLQHALAEVNEAFDAVITLQPTSPLRTSHHINKAIELFESKDNADSLVSVVKVPHNMIPESIMKKDGDFLIDYQSSNLFNRQKKPIYYARNGAAIYITKVNRLDFEVFGGNIVPFEMSSLESFDIDEEDDWTIVEKFI